MKGSDPNEKVYVTRGGIKYEKRSAHYKETGAVVRNRTGASRFCCFGNKPQEELVGLKSPDADFHASSYVNLRHGPTAYRFIEPSKVNDETADSLPVVVCLHGLYNCSYMWGDAATLLCDCEEGPRARVLVFDFYGRGRSPWTGVECTLDVFVSQTKELLDVLGLTRGDISLIGFDLGGAVALGFAAKYPNICTSLTMISPMGVLYKFIEKEELIKKKYVGEFMMYNRRVLLPGQQERDFFEVGPDRSIKSKIDQQAAMVQWQIDNTPGYLGAILSTYRVFPLRGMDELFVAVGRHSRPVLIVWGDHDNICVGRQSFKVTKECFPRAFNIYIKDCGHNPIAEKLYDTMTEVLCFHKQTYDDLAEAAQAEERAAEATDKGESKEAEET